MVKVLYCDRCGKEIEQAQTFNVEFHSFSGQYPQLCVSCEEEFQKVIKKFLSDGKKK